MAPKPTEFDKTMNRLKNQKLLVPILIIGAVIIALAAFTTALQDLWNLVKPALERRAAPATVAPATPQVSPASVPADDCRYIIVDAVFKVDTPPNANPNQTTVKFDGFKVGPEARYDTQPFPIVIKEYEPGTYNLEIQMGPVLRMTGDITFTNERYYLYKPDVKVYEKFIEAKPITLTPINRRDAERHLARYSIDLPSCEKRRSGLSW